MRYLPLPRRHVPNALSLAALGLLLLTFLAVASGEVAIPLWRIPSLLLAVPADPIGQAWRSVLVDIRLPRIVLALACGAALAVAGCTLQTVFRNPLAEPGLIGASSAAALAALLAVRGIPDIAAVPAAFAGSMAALWLAWTIDQKWDTARLLLAGLAVNAISSGGLALLDDHAYVPRNATLWAWGSLSNASWLSLAWLLPALLTCGYLIWRETRALDALLLGDREAFHLGFDVLNLRRRLLALTALTIALTTSIGGVLSFVGLVAPHLARTVIGPGHRHLLPAAAITGAGYLLCVDWLARTALSAELSLPALLNLLGAPYLLYLLIKNRH
ncbi:FecCD family ABC transporter permease [Chitinimonas sp. BJB300]|uniref:FecCD family ABC transporter permease n=1 Tax=Chitinimonas sp. BJB300 TaxID=1559339 RepID=UPI000C122A09|nr:iron ABC transporter permease [Chitinimonas sp. BJB300]PHV09874.1 iron ABC transporter [Chitinimonas sp. BJB300]TSJ90777.1 iron ABC transporter permease [Chitinimonas sp. BJB300]